MSDTVIKIDNLSKQYRLGRVGTGTLTHDIKRWWHLSMGKEDPFLKLGEVNKRDVVGESEYIWALKHVNMEVQRGQVLGIIGKNGAGKSTLLKILSRVTAPTTGEFKAKGRIASLLEVGTGFHPELTGKENVFLNGAILGMTKTEITRRFDEIVAFSGVERYIDTPVKRYSSGMLVRLAFAVAAHLEPEILIIDEVLAVGDAEFQKKCLGKMKDVSGEGRTILFVSHNMTAVKSLCTQILYLQNGTSNYMGEVNAGISLYLGGDSSNNKQTLRFSELQSNNKYYLLNSIEIKSQNADSSIITMDDSFSISIKLHKKEKENKLDITCQITDAEGTILLICGSGSSATAFNTEGSTGVFTYTFNLPPKFFNEGKFGVNLLFVENGKVVIETLYDILNIDVLPGTIEYGQWMGKSKGLFRLTGNYWEVTQG